MMKSRYRVSLASLFLNLVSSTTPSKNDTHYHSDPADFMKQFFEHNGAHGTGLAREETDPHYWASNSEVPTMPKVSGYMGTHGQGFHLSWYAVTAAPAKKQLKNQQNTSTPAKYQQNNRKLVFFFNSRKKLFFFLKFHGKRQNIVFPVVFGHFGLLVVRKYGP